MDEDLEMDCPGAYPSFLSFVKLAVSLGLGLKEVTWQPKHLSPLSDGKVIKESR